MPSTTTFLISVSTASKYFMRNILNLMKEDTNEHAELHGEKPMRPQPHVDKEL